MAENNSLKNYPIHEIPECLIHGRTDLTGEAVPLFWNGSGLELCVSGSELWIDLEAGYEQYEPWISCEINGAFITRQMLMPGRQSLCLFRGMSPGEKKTVFFRREVQAFHEDEKNYLLICGVRTDGEFFPVRERKYKLEFVGDSITSGEGTYGAKSDNDWLPMYMSVSVNYADMVGKAMNAELRLISQCGFGVYCGYDNDVRHVMPAYYDQICGVAFGEHNRSLGAAKPYDFSSWIPDAVIIHLGTNDDVAFDNPPFIDPDTGKYYKIRKNSEINNDLNQSDVKRIRTAVISFLRHLRKKNPKSLLLWVYGMIGHRLSMPIASAVLDYIEQTGDLRAAFLELPDTPEENLGSRLHPGRAAHEKAAEIIVEYLKKNL